MQFTEVENWVLERCANGELADLDRRPGSIPGRTLRASALRQMMLGLPVQGPDGKSATVSLPCGLAISNAEIQGQLNLARAHSPRGDAACPPLVLTSCTFVDVAPAPRPADRPMANIDLAHARIAHLSLIDCRLSQLDLRDAHIDGEFNFSGLGPPQEGAMCWINATGAKICGDVNGTGARLELAAHAQHPSHLPHDMALQMREASVAGSMALRAGFVCIGGLRLPRRIGGDVWIDGAELRGNGRDALNAERSDIGGCLVMRPRERDGKVLPFVAQGRINLASAHIAQGLELSGAHLQGDPTAPENTSLAGWWLRVDGDFLAQEWASEQGQALPFRCDGVLSLVSATIAQKARIILAPAATPHALVLADACIGGRLEITVGNQPIEARGLRVANESSIGSSAAQAASDVDLTFAKFGPSLFFGGGLRSIQLAAASGNSLVCLDGQTAPRQVVLSEARFTNTIHLRVQHTLDLTSLCCDDSVFVTSPPDATLTCHADSISVGKDLVMLGRFSSIAISRARLEGKLDLERSAVEHMTAVGIRVRAETLLPVDILGPIDLKASVFEGGLSTSRSSLVTRMHARRVDARKVIAEINLEDARIAGDMSIGRLEREPAHHLRREVARVLPWLIDGKAFELHERRLLCYKHATVLELQRPVEGHSPMIELASYLVSDDLKYVAPLSGQSEAIHSSATRLGLTLQTPDQVADYLRFFCGYVWTPDASFVLAESLELSPWLKLEEPSALDEIVRRLVMPAPRKTGQNWECKATLAYSGELYECLFLVEMNGMVTMMQEKSLCKLSKLPFDDVRDGLRVYAPPDASARWHPMSGAWRDQASDSERQQVTEVLTGRSIKHSIDDTEDPPVRIRLGGCRCDTLDDGDGSAWGGHGENQVRVRAELVGFIYEDLADGMRAATPEMVFNENTDHRQNALSDSLYGRELATRRVSWLKAHAAKADRFNPRPYEQLVSVLNRRGDNEAARQVLLEKMRDERKHLFRTKRWGLAVSLYCFFETPFQYGLFWRRALFTLAFCLITGTYFFDAANIGVLRMAPIGAHQDGDRGWRFSNRPILVLDSRPVNDVVIDDHGEFSTGALKTDHPSKVIKEIRCGDQIEPMVYALDVMVPLLDLHQEDKCTMSGGDHALGWRIGAMLYAVIGAYVISMVILTISGVLRRSVDR